MRRAVVLAALLTACASRPGLTEVHASADPLQWQRSGFFELHTPIRPPTTKDGRAHISVLLKLPPDARASTLPDVDTLDVAMPVGSIAVRVEFEGKVGRDLAIGEDWRVLDVRRFEWAPEGRLCSVLRPDGDGALRGLRWRCGEALDAKAGLELVSLTGSKHLAKINGCTTCHRPHRAEDRGVEALVQRGTDADGLFSIRSVLRDEDPVERYREVDANAGDPLMVPTCPGSELDLVNARCADAKRARLRFDVEAGLAMGDPHAENVCATRRALATLLDDAGRDWLAQHTSACLTVER